MSGKSVVPAEHVVAKLNDRCHQTSGASKPIPARRAATLRCVPSGN
jgi:hypothetical protein